MFELHDTFNDCIVSRHRTLIAAVKADIKFSRRVRQANGPGSYIPTSIRENGEVLSDYDRDMAKRLDYDLSVA